LTKGFLLQPTNVPPAQFKIELLDPGDPSASNALTGVSVTSSYPILESLSAWRAGGAADGASKLVVRVSTTNHGTVTLSLRTADGASGVTGDLVEDGSIGSVGSVSGSDQYSLTTSSASPGQRAYALYHAPDIYHRAGGAYDDRPAATRHPNAGGVHAGQRPVSHAGRFYCHRPRTIHCHARTVVEPRGIIRGF
jgi:hypothetical protein